MTKSKAAFLFACQQLEKETLYLWTFTFGELLDIKATRKRWNHLRTLLLQTWPNLRGLRVFEMHKEHGLHVHLLTNRFIDVNKARQLAKQAGWGRIHVTRMPSEHSSYLAKYLTKKRPECLKRWRLWDSFGTDWEPTKVKDVAKDTLFSRVYQACKEERSWEGKGNFMQRMEIVRKEYIGRIEQMHQENSNFKFKSPIQ